MKCLVTLGFKEKPQPGKRLPKNFTLGVSSRNQTNNKIPFRKTAVLIWVLEMTKTQVKKKHSIKTKGSP